MSAGLFSLLDDVAALARLAAASVDDVGAAAGRASAKAAGVVVDDTAVTPQYVRGVAAERELPIVKRIAKGSFRNKLLFILPAALLLSELLPWLLTPILMLGGTYLAYEGFEKIWGRLRGHEDPHDDRVRATGPEAEDAMVSGAVRTDLILSAEIMVIALNEVADEPLLARAAILAVVAVMITVLVYGVVALIVKIDDVGLALAERPSAAAQRVGHGAGQRHAAGAHRDHGRRHRGHAVGRWPHPARGRRRAGPARALRPRAPPRGRRARRRRRRGAARLAGQHRRLGRRRPRRGRRRGGGGAPAPGGRAGPGWPTEGGAEDSGLRRRPHYRG